MVFFRLISPELKLLKYANHKFSPKMPPSSQPEALILRLVSRQFCTNVADFIWPRNLKEMKAVGCRAVDFRSEGIFVSQLIEENFSKEQCSQIGAKMCTACEGQGGFLYGGSDGFDQWGCPDCGGRGWQCQHSSDGLLSYGCGLTW